MVRQKGGLGGAIPGAAPASLPAPLLALQVDHLAKASNQFAPTTIGLYCVFSPHRTICRPSFSPFLCARIKIRRGMPDGDPRIHGGLA